jgi:hypothetical protein
VTQYWLRTLCTCDCVNAAAAGAAAGFCCAWPAAMASVSMQNATMAMARLVRIYFTAADSF